MGNKGFSLLELLIAVAILGVIVVPLLQSFVFSARVSKKTRDVGKANLLAQNVAEAVETIDLRELAARTDDTEAVTGMLNIPGMKVSSLDWFSLKKTEDPEGKITVRLANDGAEYRGYTVKVTLNPEKYASINDVSISQYIPLDRAFLQDNSNTTENPDIQAKNTMRSEALEKAKDLAGTDAVTLTMEGDIPKRRLKVEIIEDSSTNSYEYALVFHYEWDYSFEFTGADGEPNSMHALTPITKEIRKRFAHGQGSQDESRLSSCFIFYEPNPDSMQLYDDAARKFFNEVIEVEHKNTQPGEPIKDVDLFLLPQGQSNYLCVKLKDDVRNTTQLHVGNTNTEYWIFDGRWFDPMTEMETQLVSTEKEYRMYEMTVEVSYGSEQILSYSGIKLR